MLIWFHGVMVSTPDSESGNPSSSLGGTFTHLEFSDSVNYCCEKQALQLQRGICHVILRDLQFCVFDCFVMLRHSLPNTAFVG